MATSKTTTPKKSPAAAKSAKSVVAPKAPPAKAARAVAKPEAKPATQARKAPAKEKKAKPAVSGEQRRHYVEVAAYFIAERHGFMPGRSLEDWAAAETEIDRLLAEGLLNT